MTEHEWRRQYEGAYDRALAAYAAGRQTSSTCVQSADRDFLVSIGSSAQELFDFAEDGCLSGEPALDEVLKVTALRRDYFLQVQEGKRSGRVRAISEFPAKTDAVEGIAWLPRLIVKAHARLRGELPDELMYGCAGDRPFLRSVRVGLAEFLAAVRDANGDDRAVIELVKRRRSGVPPG